MWDKAEKFLLKDKDLEPLIKIYRKCSLKPRPRKYYFEDLVDAIVQQQLSMNSATAIFNRIKKTVSENRNVSAEKRKHKWRAGETLSLVITPKDIQKIASSDLRRCGLSRSKINYIKILSDKVIRKELEIMKMDELSNKEILQELVAVKGIGRWTVEMFMMFTLARPDIFPVDDLGLRNAFQKLIKPMDKNEIEKYALRWKPYRTIASWYIWKSVEKNSKE